MTSSGLTDVELIMVGYHSRHQMEGLLAGLPDDLACAIVDNASNADDLKGLAESRPNTRYVDTGGGAGYARAANLGARTSTADYLVFVNPDTRPSASLLAAIVDDVRSDPSCISSSPLNVGADGTAELGVGGWEPSLPRALVHAVGLHLRFPRAGLFARPAVNEQIQLDWVTGSCMAVARAKFFEVGPFDERFYVYSEDVAFGNSARALGYHQRLRTDLTLTHNTGGSGAPSKEMLRLRGASMRRYLRMHHSILVTALMVAIVGLGYIVRAVLYGARGRRERAAGNWAFAKGVFTGRAKVGGVEVSRQRVLEAARPANTA